MRYKPAIRLGNANVPALPVWIVRVSFVPRFVNFTVAPETISHGGMYDPDTRQVKWQVHASWPNRVQYLSFDATVEHARRRIDEVNEQLVRLGERGNIILDPFSTLISAQAQLGDVGHFADVLTDARRSLAEAFALHHRAAGAADDAARRAALLSVVRLCAEVDAALDARTAGLAALRAEDPLKDAHDVALPC